MKKILSLVVLAGLLGVTIGCDNAKPTTASKAATTPPVTTPAK
jgi:hypothetical protein